MKRTVLCFLIILIFLQIAPAVSAATGDIVYINGFENGLNSWKRIWSGDQGDGYIKAVSDELKSGLKSLLIRNTSTGEAIFEATQSVILQPDRKYVFSAWVKMEGDVKLQMRYHRQLNAGKVFDWGIGGKDIFTSQGEWKQFKNIIVSGESGMSVIPIFLVSGTGNVWLDDIQIIESDPFLTNEKQAETLTISNQHLDVQFNTQTQLFTILDKRIKREWTQTYHEKDLTLVDARIDNNRIVLDLFLGRDDLDLKSEVFLDGNKPDVVFTLTGKGDLTDPLTYPQPFKTDDGMDLIVPSGTGLSIPVEDSDDRFLMWTPYSAFGLKMAFFGLTDGQSSLVTIINTPIDSEFRSLRASNGLLTGSVAWLSEMQKFGPERSVTLSFLDQGGITPIAKRYRKEASHLGHLKTLEEKRQENPLVDEIVGAAYINADQADDFLSAIVKKTGMEHVFYNFIDSSSKGILNGLADDDVMAPYMAPIAAPDPETINQALTPFRYPAKGYIVDGVIQANGEYISEDVWGIRLLCSHNIKHYADGWESFDRSFHDFQAYYIDAFLSNIECYSPAHPMTRSQSTSAQLDYLKVMMEDRKIVIGTEAGFDVSVPYMVFSDGMMSFYANTDFGPHYRLKVIPDEIYRITINPAYRIPLWELVYHDCVVAYNHVSDANNRYPAIWLKKIFSMSYMAHRPISFFLNKI